jgi:hypothetical protein
MDRTVTEALEALLLALCSLYSNLLSFGVDISSTCLQAVGIRHMSDTVYASDTPSIVVFARVKFYVFLFI